MATATQNRPALLEDAFRLDVETVDLSTVTTSAADTTNNGCGPSPTTGPTTGCAAPDGPVVPARGCNAA